MADWHPFGYRGGPGTCKWCGRKLRRLKVLDKTLEQDLITAGTRPYEAFERALVPAALPGGYHDGHFCGLRCAYQFAVRLADLGQQLTAAGPPPRHRR